ncbi:MAG: beta-phosphoglucomutase [Sphingorhabdus sp.]|uniref:beta-phosphoglucomutase n=1 Tax=Sphingorhabdus sp. TaxID=1902408 RepID=UPI003CA117B2
MSPVALAIFDLDGVLADTALLHFRAWKTIADDLGIDFDEDFNHQIKGVDRIGSMRAILAHGELLLTEPEVAALAERKNALYLDAVVQMTPDDLFPGVVTILENITRRGLQIAVASASRNAPLVLDRLEIADRFIFVADPSQSRPKPAPDLFIACADAANIPPSQCIGFEDAVVGITAIKEAGMRAIGIGDKQILKEADLVFSSIAAVNLEEILKI